jgi:dolichol-phosphate mannosyltransferase
VGTFIVLPTYNEADNLARLVGELFSLSVPLSVIVVDDNSPDGTGILADALVSAYPDRVVVIHRPGKLGLGTAYIAGFRRALQLGATSILTMDADFSHNPRFIPTMVQCLATADLVIGSRYTPGGGTHNFPMRRRILSRCANAVARNVLGLRARDATAGFRLYRREVIESVPLDSILSSGYSFLIEMLFIVEGAGWRVAEVPILFEDRVAGVSKISRQEILNALFTLWRLALQRPRNRTA